MKVIKEKEIQIFKLNITTKFIKLKNLNLALLLKLSKTNMRKINIDPKVQVKVELGILLCSLIECRTIHHLKEIYRGCQAKCQVKYPDHSISTGIKSRKPLEINIYSKEEKSQLNFRKWLLTMVSIGNLVLSPLIVYMGY